MEKLSIEFIQILVTILIFLIIFRDNIDFLKNKYVYYMMSIIFIINIFVLANEPAVLLLYSALYILVWYDHNIKKINKNN
jgi:hypothetical protein